MYCVIFVTVCKIRIPHNGRYFTKGNTVMEAKFFSLADQLMKLTKTSTLAVVVVNWPESVKFAT